MKRWLVGLLVLLSPSAFAQQSPPEIPYDLVANLLQLPPDMHLGEVAGVAVNSKGHILVYSRGGSSQGPAFGNTASQILEFDHNGVYLREIGKNLYAWAYAHTVRVDRERQHLGDRQGFGHGRQVQPGGPGRDGVRPQVRSPPIVRPMPTSATGTRRCRTSTAASGSRPT